MYRVTCKRQNEELGNGMRGMMGMREIRVEMMGMWEIRVKIRGIRVRVCEIGGMSEENQDENLLVVEEMMNKKCGER